MPSDDDGLAPTDGPDWENGFSDSIRQFEEAVQLWKRREEATCEEKTAGRNLNQRTVATCDFAAEDCLKAHFPDRDEDGESDAPLQSLVNVARSQREELHEVLELVRQHAEQFEGHTQLSEQLPGPGSASKKKSGADVVALLAELLDVASRNLTKGRKEAALEEDRRDEQARNGRAREDARAPRREVRAKEEYRRDDRRREEERYDDRRRPQREGGGRDDGRGRERDPYRDDYRRDDRRRDEEERYEDDPRRGRDDGRGRERDGYRGKEEHRRDDRYEEDRRGRPGPGPRRNREEPRPRSRSRGGGP